MKKAIIALAVLASGLTAAAPQFFDARNNAMGGTGVASSHYLMAGVTNPALLTRFDEGNHFGVRLPTLGVMLHDETGLIDDIDALQDEIDDVQTKLDANTATPGELLNLWSNLNALGGRSLIANAGAGFTVAMPSKNFAWALVVNSYLDAQAFAIVDPNDQNQIISAVVSGDLDALQSEGVVIGGAISEVGFAFAHQIDLGGPALAIGLTPKFQRVDTYNYSLNVSTFDEEDFDDDVYRNDDTGFNLDFGAALLLSDTFTVGLAARNLIEETYQTVTTNGTSYAYNVSPLLTAGAAFDTGMITVTADIDVTEIERFKRNDSSRVVRLGFEFDAWKWLQVRAGYQHDIEDTVDGVITAGLGISPFDVVHLDIAGMYADDDSFGGVVQMAFTF